MIFLLVVCALAIVGVERSIARHPSFKARRIAALPATRRRLQLGAGEQPAIIDWESPLRGSALRVLTGDGAAQIPITTTRTLPTHDLTLTCFDLHARRRMPFRWTWLDVEAPFRLLLPTTVLVIRVDRKWPHVIVKRAGLGDTLARREIRWPRSVLEDPTVLLERAARTLQELEAVPTPPPPTLDRAALAIDAPSGWRAWGPPASDARVHDLARALIGDGAFVPDRELVIELLGPMLIAYTASGPTLSYDALVEFRDAIIAACARVLEVTLPLSPRGVEP